MNDNALREFFSIVEKNSYFCAPSTRGDIFATRYNALREFFSIVEKFLTSTRFNEYAFQRERGYMSLPIGV